MKRSLKYLLILLLANTLLYAQQKTNPFDLIDPETTASNRNITGSDTKSTNSSEAKSVNPFDKLEEITVKPINPPTNDEKKVTETAAYSENYLFWLFLFLLLCFTAVMSLSKKKLKEIYKAYLNGNFLRQKFQINKGNLSFVHLFLYTFFFINAGIFIFLSSSRFHFPGNYSGLVLSCLVVTVIVLSKHLILWLVGLIFPIQKETSLYAFTILVFYIILGIVLLPLNILISFAPPLVADTAVYIGLGSIIATFGIRSLRGLSIASRYLVLHKFHFLLYLCAVEILPVIILIKTAMLLLG